MSTALLLDALLALAIPLVAYRALTTSDLFQGVVLYVAFGLVGSLGWARLAAPDVALVEAAVGAGITGALLLETLARLHPDQATRVREWRPARGHVRAAIGLAGVLAAMGVGTLLGGLPPEADGLGPAVEGSMDATRVAHPVTAVLLDLRAHDTLLEVAVLLVAAMAAAIVRSSAAAEAIPRAGALPSALAQAIGPAAVLVGGYLLWTGSSAPGGAFQAGATLAAGGVLLALTGRLRLPARTPLGLRLVLAAGPVVFLTAASVPLLTGQPLLAYGRHGKAAILLVELALAPTIALVLLRFFPIPQERR